MTDSAHTSNQSPITDDQATGIRPENVKVFIETYGCQMNVLDSELVQDQFQALGYGMTQSAKDADVVLLNTCSIRELSEQKVWSNLGRLGIKKREQKPGMVIGVMGCMAEREGPTIIKRMPQVDVLCGPSNLDQLPSLVENALVNRGVKRSLQEKTEQISLSGHTSRRSQTLQAAQDSLESFDLGRAFSPAGNSAGAYARITRGCNKFCSYCVVPYTRGPEMHRSPDSIVAEVRRLAASGYQEVTLLGQTVNHYAYKDGGKTTSFADLLWMVHEQVPELPRLRFLTSYPRDFTDEALDVMAQSPRICRYLHIPAQSGSNRVLRAMNRGYTVEEYMDLLQRARARMPDIRLAGDMIVGFCGETDEEHQMSVELLRFARYKSCFIFKYSPRSGTVAERRMQDDVPEGVKKARNLELLEIQGEISQSLHDEYIGQELEVLVQDYGKLRKDKEQKLQVSAVDNNVVLGFGGRKTRNLAAQAPEEFVRLTARTMGDEIVAFDGPPSLIGKITTVRADKATPLTILGSWVPGDVAMVDSALASAAAAATTL